MKRDLSVQCLIRLLFLFAFHTLELALVLRANPGSSPAPLSPSQSLAAFALESGLKISLVASEPVIADPVALCFDERGRLFVVENRGYPTGPGEGEPPAGRIAFLEDRDGDGRYETRRDFAAGLTFPNGIMPWNGGFVVTCAPDLLFLKDTDQDGQADLREILLTGFDASNTTQLRVSHPTLGLDQWIYLTSGLTGGKVTSPKHPDRPAVEFRSDSRFHPATGEFQAIDGRGQYGLTFDDYGRRFVCMNRIHIQQIVLPSRYLKRNSNLAFSETVQNVPESMVDDLLRSHNPAARIYPISRNVTTADSHAGTFTAACGVLIYRGNGLPKEYYGNAFACDPTGNLVHRDFLLPKGATFGAQPARDGHEFLASTDDWFRPVFLSQGPDGALYVCDIYRKTIEHPQYLPEAVRQRTDFDSGKGLGRIYRIAAAHSSSPAPAAPDSLSPGAPKNLLPLADVSTEKLCRMLGHGNSWHRETAQRLLIQRGSHEVVSHLNAEWRNPEAQVENLSLFRLHALWTLEALGALKSDLIFEALKDPDPGVRENALVLAEPRMNEADFRRAISHRLVSLARDGHARVRFQNALVLGELPSDAAATALAQIAVRDSADRWARAAVLSSLSSKDPEGLHRFVRALFASARSAGPLIELFQEVGRLAGAEPNPSVVKFLGLLFHEETGLRFGEKAAFISGLGAGLRSRLGPQSDKTVFQKLFVETEDQAGPMERALNQLFEEAAQILSRSEQSFGLRRIAAELLGSATSAQAAPALLAQLEPAQPVELQRIAIQALGNLPESLIARWLLAPERFRHFTPDLREAALAVLLSKPAQAHELLDALESGRLPHAVLDAGRRNSLKKHPDESLRERANQLFTSVESSDRMKVFENYKSILQLESDAEKGKGLFQQHCAPCHRLDQAGIAVGPDLFGIRNQPKEAILLHVLVPEYEIVPGFAGYTIETKDGRTLSGLIVSETDQSMTLRAAGGLEETVLRTQVLSMTASSLSLMPQELEATMTRQELADLVAYLKGE